MKKTESTDVAAVERYLAAAPETARATLGKVREAIRAAAPKEAEECMSYRMPAFRYKGVLVSYAAFKGHCSLFPMSAALMDAMKDEVAKYRTAKGTLQFGHERPLPAALVKKIVRARVRQNEAREKSGTVKRRA